MRAAPSNTERVRAGVLVVLLHLAVGAALVRGFDIRVPLAAQDALKVFDLPAPLAPPPPPPEPEAAAASRGGEQGAAAPPALEARPTPVVVPEPKVRTPVPTAITAAPVAADGGRATSGAAPNLGLGTGAAGQGGGTGAGGTGTGPGAGGVGDGLGSGSGARTPARLISGRITRRDYPRSAWREDLARRVGVRFTVGIDGRASGCRVLSTSGSERVDSITCRTIEQVFRYEPARDSGGQPVAVDMVWTQVLWTERDEGKVPSD